MGNLKTEIIALQIRDFINNSTIKKTKIYLDRQNGNWNQFFTALDTIEDSSQAVKNFKICSEELFLENPYIIIYGLLQALFIQQDAVNYLKTSLFGKTHSIDWGSYKYNALLRIRQIRNETIGHPSRTTKNGKNSKYDRNEITSCTIDRSSISKKGFEYLLWMHSKNERKTINFFDTINLQDKYLAIELELIMKKLQEEEKKHKAQFTNEKLSGLLNKPSLYELNLIYGFRWDDHLAWPSFDYFYKTYKKIRNGLESRYGKFGETLRISGTEEIIKKLDFIFLKIETYKNTKKYDNYELEIYVDALISSLKELNEHLIETDEEFSPK